MKKWIRGILTVFTLIFFAFGIAACGKDSTASGSNNVGNGNGGAENGGAFLYEKIEGKEEYRVTGYNPEYGTEVVVPATYQGKPVTEIGAMAFMDCDQIVSVTLPDSVVAIEHDAFVNCNALKNITFGKNLKTIGSMVFSSCSIENILLPDTLEYVDTTAFLNCHSLQWNEKDGLNYLGSANSPYLFLLGNSLYTNTLEEITEVIVEPTCKWIADNAFNGCTKIKSVKLPNGIPAIGGNTFERCSALTDIEIPNTVTSIGGGAFADCTGLTGIEIPKGVTFIGGDAFRGCTGLLNITIPDDVTQISDSAFEGCSSLTDIIIPEGVTSISYSAFADCTGLLNIDIPDTVTEIASGAFKGCSSLTDISIPEGVTAIEVDTFRGCTNLAKVNIPSSVTAIQKTYSQRPFWDCKNLAEFVVSSNNTTYQSIDGNLYSKDGKELIEYAVGKTDVSFVIPDSVTTIRSYAFENCANLVRVTIPNSVTSIEWNAFYRYGNNYTIYCEAESLPSGWSEQCFSDSIPIVWNCQENDVANNGVYTFIDGIRYKIWINWAIVARQSKAIVEVNIPKKITYKATEYEVTEIDDEAFWDCDHITSVTIPDSVTKIGYRAFGDCDNLTSFNVDLNNPHYQSIEGNLYSKDGTCFIQYAAGKTESVFVVPVTVTHIGEYAFCNCVNLTSVIIPKSVTHIERYGFLLCDKLTIYCMVESQPDGWERNWNFDNYPVEWGYTIEE